jgi:three-Cys-motif partner protein
MTHTFGGSWTEEKLAVMRSYFAAYAQALKNQSFAKWYIDAFAGTGEWNEVKRPGSGEIGFFGDDASEVGEVKDGSVRIALGIDPPFDRYIFVDVAKERVEALEALRDQFPERRIKVLPGDANQVLKDLCQSINWRKTRAAVFIDPYGMQVKWSTLESLATTKAVDIALLYPTGPLNRMLAKDGNIPREWAKRIDDHLGLCDWRNASYEEGEQIELFPSNSPALKKTMNADGLRQFVFDRLKSIFPFVCETQLELKNSRGAVLYHLFIICANPTPAAGKLAMTLARSAVTSSGGSRR